MESDKESNLSRIPKIITTSLEASFSSRKTNYKSLPSLNPPSPLLLAPENELTSSVRSSRSNSVKSENEVTSNSRPPSPSLLSVPSLNREEPKPQANEQREPKYKKYTTNYNRLRAIFKNNDLIVAITISFLMGIFFSFGLRFHADTTKNVFNKSSSTFLSNTTPQFTRSTFSFITSLMLFQAVPCFLVHVIMLFPFFRNFPHQFRYRDPFTMVLLSFSFIFLFTFNLFLASFGSATEEFVYYFGAYWIIYIMMLPLYPLVCRIRLLFVERRIRATLARLDDASMDMSTYDNFCRFTPFGPTVVVSTLLAGLSYYIQGDAPWVVAFLLLLLFLCAGLYYRDHLKTFSRAMTSSTYLLRYDPRSDFFRDTLKPNLYYVIAWTLAIRIFGLLGQIYTGTLCALSTDPSLTDFKSEYQRCLIQQNSQQASFWTQLFLTLTFRALAAVATVTVEYISVLAFLEGDFIHFSYFWRHTEDLIVAIGLVNTTSPELIVVLLIFNFVFVAVRDCGLIDDLIFSLSYKKWVYAMEEYVKDDPGFLTKIFDEIQTQAIRSKLNFFSRMTSSIYIGTIAIFDRLFFHGDSIWPANSLTNIFIILVIVMIELFLSRWLSLIVFTKKMEFVNRLNEKYYLKNDVFKTHLDEFNLDDSLVILHWRTFLYCMDAAAMFILATDLSNLPGGGIGKM
ncbi:hypothetical protein BKA69DRAFT_631162 [Paraphysoderma sedebokerense]|nr:hypothetical protein BKA69DRAFT_631162 [Paraphysoderma sedebokerense]